MSDGELTGSCPSLLLSCPNVCTLTLIGNVACRCYWRRCERCCRTS